MRGVAGWQMIGSAMGSVGGMVKRCGSNMGGIFDWGRK